MNVKSDSLNKENSQQNFFENIYRNQILDIKSNL